MYNFRKAGLREIHVQMDEMGLERSIRFANGQRAALEPCSRIYVRQIYSSPNSKKGILKIEWIIANDKPHGATAVMISPGTLEYSYLPNFAPTKLHSVAYQYYRQQQMRE